MMNTNNKARTTSKVDYFVVTYRPCMTCLYSKDKELPAALCRARTRVLLDTGEHPTFVLSHVVDL